MSKSGEGREDRCCPCGGEPVHTSEGPHLLGAECRDQVARHVRRRFGAHRYGGAHVQSVDDFVHDCYVRLLAPGGLDSFKLLPGKQLPDAFRGWLYGVVRYYCNSRHHHVQSQLEDDDVDGIPETPDPVSSESIFARQRLAELLENAIAEVEPNWRAKGLIWSERFDVLLPLVLGEDTDHERARQRLGESQANAKQLKWRLVDAIRASVDRQLRDDLFLEPGVTAKEIDRRTGAELEELIQLAFPEKKPWERFCKDAESEPPPTGNTDADDEPPELRP